MGKVIYNPSGKAGEYSYWAANFYNGCSNDCEYCYCKRGVLSHVWSTQPTLKKSLVNIETAKKIFVKELLKNKESLKENGLFFNFNSDPMLRETIGLNVWAFQKCYQHSIPVKLLTKKTWWTIGTRLNNNVCPGFTLTGCDELEPFAATNRERIKTMKRLFDFGYKTWASIEPIINLSDSLKMIKATKDICHLFKIGLKSGKKYDKEMLALFMAHVFNLSGDFRLYYKDEFLKQANVNRRDLISDRYVNRDYKLWL